MTKNAAVELAKEVNELTRIVILLEARIAMLERWVRTEMAARNNLAKKLGQIEEEKKKLFAEQVK